MTKYLDELLDAVESVRELCFVPVSIRPLIQLSSAARNLELQSQFVDEAPQAVYDAAQTLMDHIEELDEVITTYPRDELGEQCLVDMTLLHEVIVGAELLLIAMQDADYDGD